MKRRITILLSLALAWCMGSGALAQEDTGESLGRLWNAIVGFTERTGDSVSAWIEDPENGAAAWAQNAAESVEKWVQDAANGMSAFFEQADAAQWMEQAGEFFANAGDEISRLWDTFTHNNNRQEAQKAYAALKEWMDANNVDPTIRQAVEGMANAAGIKAE
jgi:hypothetical protein